MKSEKELSDTMTFRHLLTAICFVAPLAGGFAKGNEYGSVGAVIGAIFGLVIGLGSSYVYYSVNCEVESQMRTRKKAMSGIIYISLWAAFLACSVAPAFLAGYMTKAFVNEIATNSE